MKQIVLIAACACAVFLIAARSSAQSVPKIDLAKKIAEATPRDLPQSPVEIRPSTDARDDGLKGKIKSVLETTQYQGRRTREVYQDNYYNESGNLTSSVHYDEGYPRDVIVFGFIDKMRVTRAGEVAYAPGEKPSPKNFTLSFRPEDNAKDRFAPRDPRYKMRAVHQYDSQGRLIEVRSHQNNGEMWHKTTYSYEGYRRTERGFGQDGNEMTKSVYVVDSSGNDIEQQMYGANDTVAEWRFMTYVSDKAGNWIVKREFEESTVKKKKVRKLLWTNYRTIIYYP